MSITTARLHQAGLTIGSDDFDRLVVAAVEEILPVRPAPDARRELSRDELDFLADAGANLWDFAPRDRGVASPLAETAADYAALLATAFTVPQMATQLGTSEKRVRQWLTRHTLFGIKDGKVWRVPRFQLDETGTRLVPGLNRVVPHWIDAHPLEVARWFTLPHEDLADPNEQPLSPREWLLTGGDVDTIAALADELQAIA